MKPPQTTAPSQTKAPAASNGDAIEETPNRPPELCEGIELIGQYEDSGFKEAPFIIRRSDGQILQFPEPLYRIAEASDGQRSLDQIADDVGPRVGLDLSGKEVGFLVEKKLRPLGVIASPDGKSPEFEKVDPLLALSWRKSVVPERAVAVLTSFFKPLFFTPVVVVLSVAFVAFAIWFFGIHGVAQPVRAMLYQPALLLAMFGGVIIATAFHEFGHATGCRYGGAKPGALGVGLYVVWPVFYSDVTDSYRLGRAGRLRTDLGGIYFNAIFALLIGGVYFATGFEPVLVLAMVGTFAMVQQLLPLGRLDGYLIMTDLTGVPDMLTRMKPVLQSLVPGREADERVRELKPWVRVVTTSYLALLVPVLLFLFVMMLVSAPRVFATGYDSLGVHLDAAREAFGSGKILPGLGSGLQMVALLIPAVGMVATTARVGKRAGSGALSWSAGSRPRRAGLSALVAAAVGFATFILWPNGDYQPIQPGERGTVGAGINTLEDVPGGRPGLTSERAKELDGAPSIRQLSGSEQKRAGDDPTERSDAPTRTPEDDQAAPAEDGQAGASEAGAGEGSVAEPGPAAGSDGTGAPAEAAPQQAAPAEPAPAAPAAAESAPAPEQSAPVEPPPVEPAP